MQAVLGELAVSLTTDLVAAGLGFAARKGLAKREPRTLQSAVDAALHRAFDAALRADVSDDPKRLAKIEGRLNEAFDSQVRQALIATLGDHDDSMTRHEEFGRLAHAALDGRSRAPLRGALDVDAFVAALPSVLWDELLRLHSGWSAEGMGLTLQVRTVRLLERLESAVLPEYLPEPTPDQLGRDVRHLLHAIEAEASGHRALPFYLPAEATDRVHREIRVRHRRSSETQDRDAFSSVSMDELPDRAHPPGERHARSWPEHSWRGRTVVLGHPGTGKSWLIRTECRRLARAAIEAVDAGHRPEEVVIPLSARCDELVRSAGDTIGETLAAAVGHRLRLPPGLRQWLADRIDGGKIQVFLDAWDELPGREERDRIKDLLITLPQIDDLGPSPLPFVLTSRIAGYGGAPLPRPWTEVDLVPFEEGDINAVVTAWGLESGAEHRLRARLKEPTLARMVRNPLLLALLCSVAAEPEPLPTIRWQLYERVVRMLLGRDRVRPATEGGSSPEDIEELLHGLSSLAKYCATSDSGWIDEITVDVVAQVRRVAPEVAALGPNPRKATSRIASSGLVVPTAGHALDRESPYQFVHRTVAEYLVARSLAQRPIAEWSAVVAEHLWFDQAWAETTPMLGGQLDDPRPLLELLLDRTDDPFHWALRTAARVVGELPDDTLARARQQVDHIVAKLLYLVRFDPAADAAVEGLSALSSRVPVECLGPLIERVDTSADQAPRRPDADLDARSYDEVANIIRSLAPATGHARVRRALLRVARDGAYGKRRAAIVALAGCADHPEVRAVLLQLLDADDWDARKAAVESLGSAAGWDAEVRGALAGHLADDGGFAQHGIVQQSIVTVLAPLARQPEVLEAFIAQIRRAPDASYQIAEALAMANGDDRVRSELHAVAEDATAPREVREAAAQILSREMLRSRAEKLRLIGFEGAANTEERDDELQRLRDVQELVGHRPNRVADSSTGVLFDRLRQATDLSVRIDACNMLSESGLLTHDDVRSLVAALVAANSAEHWSSAAHGLAAYADLPEVGSAFLDLLRNTDDPTVLQVTMTVLASELDRAEVRQAFIVRLEHADWTVRARAVEKLAELVHRDEVARAIVHRLENDPEYVVRRDAAEALSAVADRDEIRAVALVLLHDHRNSNVRALACKVLAGALHNRQISRTVLDQLTRDDSSVKYTAVDGVSSIGAISSDAARSRLISVCAELDQATYTTLVAVYQPLHTLANKAFSALDRAEHATVIGQLSAVTRAVTTDFRTVGLSPDWQPLERTITQG